MWTVICERVFVDTESNLASLNVLEEVSFTGPPPENPGETVMLSPPFELLSMWEVEGEESLTLRIDYVAPGENTLVSQVADFNNLSKKRYRSRVRFPGILYTGPGTYRIRVARQTAPETFVPEADVAFDVSLAADQPPVQAPS